MSAPVQRAALSVVSSAGAYRKLAGRLPAAGDLVLEIGCSTGMATRHLAKTGARVVAVDNSHEFTARLAAEMAGTGNVRVACVDARNVPDLIALAPDPTLIFMDIGGNARLDSVAQQLRLCLQTFRPRRIVVRSEELSEVVGLVDEREAPDEPTLLPPADLQARSGREANLLDLSRGACAEARAFAVRNLARFDTPAARTRMAELAADPSPRVRRNALQACKRVGIEVRAPAEGA